MMDRLLYVDDEQSNLDIFSSTFGREYELFCVPDAREALIILKNEGEMSVVISDQRMSGITGVEFLGQVKTLYPDTVRILLTAYSDAEDIIDSINRGSVYRYIIKPWNVNELRYEIKNSAERYRLTKENHKLFSELKQKTSSLEMLNRELEERVNERTKDIVGANQLLTRLNDQLFQANLRIETQSRDLIKVNEDLSIRLQELETAQKQVKTLQGMLPICSYCKKIRDDQSYWQDLVSFMARNTDIAFTHSICPDCYRLYVEPELLSLKCGNPNNASSKSK